MMTSAYLKAYEVMGREEYRDFALKTIDFLMKNSYRPRGGMYHSNISGKPGIEGLLDDQVKMGAALLDAYEVTGKERYLNWAKDLMGYSFENLWDKEKGGFFDSLSKPDALGVLSAPNKPFEDVPSPAANSVAAMVLDRLYYLTNDEKYRTWAEETLKSFAGSASGVSGVYIATYGLAVDYHINYPLQAVIVGKRESKKTISLWEAALRTYRPRKVVALYDTSNVKLESLPPAVQAIFKSAPGDGSRAYICAGTSCAPPTDKPGRVSKLVKEFGKKAL